METALVFKSEKKLLISLFTWLFPIISVGGFLFVIFTYTPTVSDILIFSWLIITSAYQLFIWFFTYYTLQDNKLTYRSGFSKGTIPISSIRKIEINAKPTIGKHYTLAMNGINIYFNRWDEIYISPENKELFVNEFIKRNPEIEVIDAKAKTAVNS